MNDTKTTALLSAWASTHPWDCLVHETTCCSPTHDHSPMVNDQCAIESCREPLLVDETCYAVTELGVDERGRERWVCWRHVQPDAGPQMVR